MLFRFNRALWWCACCACDVIHANIPELLTKHPKAFLVINLTMYPYKKKKTLTTFSVVLQSTVLPQLGNLAATQLNIRMTPPPHSSRPPFASSQVRQELSKLRAKKAMGPDHIHPRVLRACAEVFYYLFSLFLKLRGVTQLWKNSCISPVPKVKHPRTLNDYRMVALTYHEGL